MKYLSLALVIGGVLTMGAGFSAHAENENTPTNQFKVLQKKIESYKSSQNKIGEHIQFR